MKSAEWRKLAERGTRGDMVYDLIRDLEREESKMTKKQMHIRASALTERQIEDLCAWLGTTKTGAMALAIERLWQEMKKEQQDNEA